MATKDTIIYVTREIERALGTIPNEHYLIVTNRTAYGEKVRNQYPDFVILIDNPAQELLSTGDLIKDPKMKEVVEAAAQAGAKPHILVFKNTARIEPLVQERGWTLLNPPAAVSEKIENKISQISWLGNLVKYLPPHRLEYMKNVPFEGTPFITQWAHGHTGTGTTLINSEAELKALQAKFPERRTRVTEYIQGPSFTVNVIATPDKTLPGSVSYQITGLAPFTDNGFSTVGNDWGVTSKILSSKDVGLLEEIVMDVGNKMRRDNWRGLFGIDFIKDTKNNRIYLIEINARQAASSPFESDLQKEQRAKGVDGMTVFEGHLAALLGQSIEKPIIEIGDGAQIVQRITKTVREVPEDAVGSLELAGYKVMAYENTKESFDLIRIQSMESVMKSDNLLNDNGQKIADMVSGKSL
jgi:predicted ATP-grasp superfamily ATP-dependent carboligase